MPIATHVLLDPRLPEDIKAYFRARSVENAPPFKCEEFEEGHDVYPRMAAWAQRFAPAPIVALASKQEVPLFDKAAVRHSQVSVGANGWLLTEFPEAVPLPPLKPPLLWDERGRALIPDPEFDPRQRFIRSRYGRHERRDISSFGSGGAARSFPLGEWIAAVDDQCQLVEVGGNNASAPLVSLVDAALGKQVETTWLWAHERSFFFLGPRTKAIEKLAPHHQVAEPLEGLSILRDAIGQLNPWRSENWLSTREALLAACGLDLNVLLNPPSYDSTFTARLGYGFPSRPRKTVTRVADPDVRGFLEELADRDVVSDEPSHAFLFQALAEAPLLSEQNPPNRLTHVALANLGAGNIVEVAAYQFKGEKPERLVAVASGYASPRCFDGRDVRLEVTEFTAQVLEGTALMPKRRRAAARGASSDDD